MCQSEKSLLSYVIGVVLALIVLLLALPSPANALDVGVGIGICDAGFDHSELSYCNKGHVEKVFVRHIHMINDKWGVEGELYHFSHLEKGDRAYLGMGGGDEFRSWGVQGISANVFYRFF